MNRFLDGEPGAGRRRQRLDRPAAGRGGGLEGPAPVHRLDRNVGFGAASNAGVAEAAGDGDRAAQPGHRAARRRPRPARGAAAELGALVGPRVLNPDGSVQPSASGPEVGAWPWVRALVPAAMQPAALRAHTEPYRLERRLEVSWLTGSCVAGPTARWLASARSTRRCTCSARTSTSACAPAPPGCARAFDPRRAGSSTTARARRLAYGSREGWRPTGTLNWRAAVRRAYGPRREWLGWLACGRTCACA